MHRLAHVASIGPGDGYVSLFEAALAGAIARYRTIGYRPGAVEVGDGGTSPGCRGIDTRGDVVVGTCAGGSRLLIGKGAHILDFFLRQVERLRFGAAVGAGQ